jgi:hypothetical protein
VIYPGVSFLCGKVDGYVADSSRNVIVTGRLDP